MERGIPNLKKIGQSLLRRQRDTPTTMSIPVLGEELEQGASTHIWVHSIGHLNTTIKETTLSIGETSSEHLYGDMTTDTRGSIDP